ncbi:4Fe-4S dicluster domain-containing protein [bacterium]|nr:4Fe-4S dicluster domain-containing protein [bacterium]
MDSVDRRKFLGLVGNAGAVTLASGLIADRADASESSKREDNAHSFGCLVDTTQCVGCRSCEEACNMVNELPKPETSFNDMTVLDEMRRPDASAYTVVNRYYPNPPNVHNELEPVFVKVQCMHCNDPACVSACIVGAMEKTKEGPIIYDPAKCIGCRYCMVACPFQIPAYEYHNSLTPEVRKCNFCFEKYTSTGEWPACARACPREAIVFGTREELLVLARKRIRKHPGRYVNKIFGENEIGGTSWMYLASTDFAKIGFEDMRCEPVPVLSETLQHSVFKYFLPPLALYAVLAVAMFLNKPTPDEEDETESQDAEVKNVHK